VREDATGTEKRVCEDIAKRQALGRAKYGATVEENPLSLRDWLQHAYEETLDKAIYLRRAIEKLDAQAQERDAELLSDLDELYQSRAGIQHRATWGGSYEIESAAAGELQQVSQHIFEKCLELLEIRRQSKLDAQPQERDAPATL
jgi:predicted phage-related endonuclease